MDKVILATVMTVSIGVVAGYLGTLMLSKRMALAGDPLSHLALPGIALALIYGLDVSLGAFGSLVVGVVGIWLLEKRTKLPLEAVTAIVFSLSVALTFLFLPAEEIEMALIGDISQISFWVVIWTALASVVAFLIVAKIYKIMVFITVSEDLAKSEKVNVDKYNLIYLLAVALIIGLGVRVVGGLLTAAIISIPAATSRNLSTNMRQYAYGGAIAGGLAAIIGIMGHQTLGIPAGPAVIISSAGLFLVSMVLKRG